MADAPDDCVGELVLAGEKHEGGSPVQHPAALQLVCAGPDGGAGQWSLVTTYSIVYNIQTVSLKCSLMSLKGFNYVSSVKSHDFSVNYYKSSFNFL